MRQHCFDGTAGQLLQRTWKRFPVGHSAKGERLYDRAPLPWVEQEGWKHTLLLWRSVETKPEYAFYFTYAPKQKSTRKTPVSVAGWR